MEGTPLPFKSADNAVVSRLRKAISAFNRTDLADSVAMPNDWSIAYSKARDFEV